MNRIIKKVKDIDLGKTITTVFFLAFIFSFACKNIAVPFEWVSVLKNGTSTVADVTAGAEEAFNATFPKKTAFVNANGLIHKITLQRLMNGVYLLNNGHGSAGVENASDITILNNAKAVKGFSDWCQERGITFTWAQVPYKNEEGNSQLPAGMEDYSNDVTNRFLNNLDNFNVDYIDLRDSLSKSENGFYSNFYKTEHHWNCFGGFNAFVDICKHMEQEYGDSIDPVVLDRDNYQVDVYEGMHSGYYGDRVGNVFLPAEDFFLLYPKFETHQTCNIIHHDVTRTGNFYDAVFDQSFLTDDHIHGMYGAYIGGDFPLVEHYSDTAQTDKTIVIFIDSFGTIPESFLTTAYKRVIAIDLRWVLRNGWTTTAVQYVERYDADHVVVMFNPNHIVFVDSEQFKYGVEDTASE